MKPKVLYLALTFAKLGQANSLYSDLMEEFSDRGHEVYILASTSDQKNVGYSKEGKLHVIRAKVPKHQNVGNIQKGISNMLLPIAYKRALKKYLPKSVDFDLVITPTPPITLAKLACYIKKKFNAEYYLILRDIFPQNAVDLGFMRKQGAIHTFFRKMEKKMYSYADHIGCMSPANVSYVKQNNPEVLEQKLHILRNWQRKITVSEKTKEQLKEKFKVSGKFVLFFGGNIGKPQKIENLLHLAENYRHDSELSMVIVGSGTEAKRLETEISKRKLYNIKLIDALPRDRYFEVMQMADIGLISLDERFTIPNLPSKVLSYFNAKLPVVAIVDRSTDFGSWVQDEIKAGFWNTFDNMEEIVQRINQIRNDKKLHEQLGMNGYNYFCKNLLVANAYEVIMDRMSNEPI